MDLLEKALLELALAPLEEKGLITRKRSGKRTTNVIVNMPYAYVTKITF